MKRIIIIILILGAGGVLGAQSSGFGAGIVLGEPSGLTAKLWLNAEGALDLGAAWSFVRGGQDGADTSGALYLHAAYLHHFFGVIDIKPGRLVPYLGGGGKISFSREPTIGVRIPFGLVYMFSDVPLDVFLEVAPGINLLPATTFDGSGGIGIRYWFK